MRWCLGFGSDRSPFPIKFVGIIHLRLWSARKPISRKPSFSALQTTISLQDAPNRSSLSNRWWVIYFHIDFSCSAWGAFLWGWSPDNTAQIYLHWIAGIFLWIVSSSSTVSWAGVLAAEQGFVPTSSDWIVWVFLPMRDPFLWLWANCDSWEVSKEWNRSIRRSGYQEGLFLRIISARWGHRIYGCLRSGSWWPWSFPELASPLQYPLLRYSRCFIFSAAVRSLLFLCCGSF